MPAYNDTLETMVARVLAAKPNAMKSEVVRQINARIREVIDGRIYWSDLLATRIISFPDAYTTGTVSTSYNSNKVTGAATSWPVSDTVNTVVQAGVQDIGYQEITPSSMTGISVGSLLYCDSAGNPETVSVVEVTPVSFWAKFYNAHNPNFTVTASSLAGRQIRFGTNWPTFTVNAVTSPTELLMDMSFGGPALTGQPYQIMKIYVTIDANLKVILDVVDQQVGRKIEPYIPVEIVNQIDPQRSQTGDPFGLVQYTPNQSGIMQYEIWPAVSSSRQLSVICGLQWPELKDRYDRPPWFIDPNVFVTGAIAESLRIQNLNSKMDRDPWYNPQVSMQYEQMFRLKLQEVVNADEAKAQRAYSHAYENLLSVGGAAYWRGHDQDVSAWSL